MIEEKYRHVADYCQNGIDGIRRTGLKILEFRRRYIKIMMPIKGNGNHVGIMYAGSLFSLGEASGGFVFASTFDPLQYYPIIKEVHIKFVKPATTDVTLIAELNDDQIETVNRQLNETGRSKLTATYEIKDATNEVVAIVHGNWPIRKLPEGFRNPLAR
jgi:acyl-coenzyme A thioesterase PaaI-like protein